MWKRTLASQMVDARLTQDKVRLETTLRGVAGFDGDVPVGLSATGLRIEFPGFRRAYVEGTDDPEAELADQERILPPLSRGRGRARSRAPRPRDTTRSPRTATPRRRSIKKLEDLGIGRPSTYASVMKTIDRRGYVWKKGKSLVPAFRAFAVVNLLQQYFADLVDYQFTAAMEDELDEIAQGNQDLEPWLRKFYFGDPDGDDGVGQARSRTHDARAPRVRLRRHQLDPARRGRRRRRGLACAPVATGRTSCTAMTASRSPRRPSPIHSASPRPSSCSRPRATTANSGPTTRPGCRSS